MAPRVLLFPPFTSWRSTQLLHYPHTQKRTPPKTINNVMYHNLKREIFTLHHMQTQENYSQRSFTNKDWFILWIFDWTCYNVQSKHRTVPCGSWGHEWELHLVTMTRVMKRRCRTPRRRQNPLPWMEHGHYNLHIQLTRPGWPVIQQSRITSPLEHL